MHAIMKCIGSVCQLGQWGRSNEAKHQHVSWWRRGKYRWNRANALTIQSFLNNKRTFKQKWMISWDTHTCSSCYNYILQMHMKEDINYEWQKRQE